MKDQLLKLVTAIQRIKADPEFDDRILLQLLLEEITAIAVGDRQQSDATKWQPIETAPKDGTPILGWAEGVTATVYWYKGRTESWWQLAVVGSFCDDGEWVPELWRELPESPFAEHCRHHSE